MQKKRRRLYFAAIIVGFIGLFVDRVILSGDGAPASAVAADGLVAGATTIAPDVEHTSEPSIPELPFPHDVKRFTRSEHSRDVFAPPTDAALHDGTTDNPLLSLSGSGLPMPTTSANFPKVHKLEGILSNGRLKIAIVDGQWMRIGDVLEACKVITIEGSEVRFKCFDGEAVLTFRRSDEKPGG